jgi:hypothetical protein
VKKIENIDLDIEAIPLDDKLTFELLSFFTTTATTTGTTTINVAPVNDAPITSSTTISVAEESTNTPLGLTAPTDADGNPLTITVTGLPSVGSITLADGTPVSNGQMLTAAQLAGLQYDAPADLAAATTTSFNYSVSDGTVTTAGTTTINVAPVNDAPVTSSTTIDCVCCLTSLWTCLLSIAFSLPSSSPSSLPYSSFLFVSLPLL